MIDREKYAADIMRDTHKLILEALRQREQEIIRFLAILGPAMAGYIWLIKAVYCYKINQETFVIGAIAVVFTLFIGAWYAITLGYNFRYIIFYLSKIEDYPEFDRYIPAKWPRKLDQFQKSSLKCSKIPYCTPPEIIKVFWQAFNFMIIGIWISVFMINTISFSGQFVVFLFGMAATLISYIIIPISYGCRLHDVYDSEEKQNSANNKVGWPKCIFAGIWQCLELIKNKKTTQKTGT